MEITTILAAMVSLIAGVAYATFFFRYLSRFRPITTTKSYEQAKERFFHELANRISLGVLRTVEDASQIQRPVKDEIESQRFSTTPIDELLESYLSVITGSVEEVGEQTAKERYALVQELINTKRAAEPFSVLPARERITAHLLQEAIEFEQRGAALSRLRELSSALGARLDEANRKATRNLYVSIGAILVSITAIPLSIVL